MSDGEIPCSKAIITRCKALAKQIIFLFSLHSPWIPAVVVATVMPTGYSLKSSLKTMWPGEWKSA